MALLSIIVPLYNQEKYIEQCVKSILGQTYKDIRVIIVDDGSTDNGLKLCLQIAKKDARVKVIQQKNKGLLQARYTGLKYVDTEYVTFVDADDYILAESYSMAQNAMNDHCDMILFEITRLYGEKNQKTEHQFIEAGYYDKRKIEKEIYPQMIWDFRRNVSGLEVSQCVRIVKTDILKKEYEKIGENNFYYGEDAAISYPLYTEIESLCVIPESYYLHRQRVQTLPSYLTDDNFFFEVTRLYQYLMKRLEDYLNQGNIKRQLEYYYMYSIQLRKKVYGDISKRNFLFPFNKVPKGQRIVLYGAGEVGESYYAQLMELGYCTEVLWVDQNAENMIEKGVKAVERLFDFQYDYIVIAIENTKIKEQVREWLLEKEVDIEKIL